MQLSNITAKFVLLFFYLASYHNQKVNLLYIYLSIKKMSIINYIYVTIYM